jgi:hypothetical protein
MNPWLAEAILGAHLVVIAFNVLGLAAIPVGAALGWAWVRIRWWRLLHLASWAVVAVQAALGRACFLTLWQDAAAGAPSGQPLIARWIDSLVYWPLPVWAFAVLYLVLFALVVWLWIRVRPTRRAPAGRAEGRGARRA